MNVFGSRIACQVIILADERKISERETTRDRIQEADVLDPTMLLYSYDQKFPFLSQSIVDLFISHSLERIIIHLPPF